MRIAAHAPTPREASAGGATARTPGVDAVAALLAQAATLAPTDPAWTTVRAAARRATTRLAASGQLSPTLVVAPDDPPVVVARTLAAAWRAVGARVRCQRTGSDPWASSTTAVG